ncbi:MAG: efflux RND transporter permease subunit [Alphaproteobacteria bacterium]|nr:efflux RND transporter permease subunit [Alphaproteobacteria bacterium]
MLTRIVRFSLQFRWVVLCAALLVLCYGFYMLTKAQYDVFPEFAPPQVAIQTEAPGLSPEQVEALVTQPVETAINGVPGIESLRSSSIQGLSVIKVTFDVGSDIYRDRQAVTERLATLGGQLPQGIKAPIMTPLTSSTSVVLAFGLTSDTLSLMQLRTQADWVVKQRLLAVPGVAKVTVFGGDVRQLQIQLLPDKLRYYNLALDDVIAVAQKATNVLGAGFIDTANQRITLQTEGQADTAEKLAKTVLLRGSGELVDLNITLGDIAIIQEAPEPPAGRASVMGKNGVIISISSQYGANTLEVTQQAEKAIAELKPALEGQGITVSDATFRPANFVETAIGSVKSALMLGAVLVVMVLFVFLRHTRSALISATAIPLSLVTAAAVLSHFGYSLNTMTLGGLAIAIGGVVDDAVIGIENVLRRLRENSLSDLPRSRLSVILDASVEVRTPVVFASIAIILVFVPVLTMSGLGGRLFAPLGIAHSIAILMSLVVALTVTPALCMIFLRDKDTASHEPHYVTWLKRAYTGRLDRVERSPTILLLFVGLLTLGSLVTVPFLKSEFIPELREGHFIVHMSAIPGTSLDESIRIGNRVTDALKQYPFVRSITQQAGRAELADDTWGTHYSEFDVDLKPLSGEEMEQAEAQLNKALDKFIGVHFSVKTFLTERVEETISGYTAGVALNIYGPNLNDLDKAASDVLSILQSMQGAANVQPQSPPGTPQLSIRLRWNDLQYWGFDATDVLNAVRIAYQGESIAQIYEGNRVTDVSVILAPDVRKSISQLRSLPLRAPSGAYARLEQLADVTETSGRYVVLRDSAQRVQTITFDVTGKEEKAFIDEAQKQIKEKVQLPPGTYISFASTAEAQAQSRRDLMLNSLMTAIAIVALLSIVMGNRNNLLLVLANLPFALVGGVLSVVMSGGILSLGALVGFVTLFGITLRNSVMMIAHYEHLVSEEGHPWNLQTALLGASERLLPIVMTALVTALGLLPLALGSGDPGREIEGPMAIVILGGLITSTALNLLVLPTLALRYGKFGQRAEE